MSPPNDELRERILNALATVIARHGYAGCRLGDVASTARVSLRTFYLEFGNKQGCFLELHRRSVIATCRAIDARVTFDGEWRAAMVDEFAAYFDVLGARPKLSFALVREMPALGPEGVRSDAGARSMLAALLCWHVEQGRAANAHLPTRPLTPIMARTIVAGIVDYATEPNPLRRPSQIPAVIDAYAGLLWSLVVDGAADRSTASTQGMP